MLFKAQLQIMFQQLELSSIKPSIVCIHKRGFSLSTLDFTSLNSAFFKAGLLILFFFERMNIRGACLIKDKPIPKTQNI